MTMEKAILELEKIRGSQKDAKVLSKKELSKLIEKKYSI